ncbi:MAG: hypothetical protein WA862_06400 [Solirubrobacterales bacterium]
MSSPNSEDFANDLVVAKERDLKPLHAESEEVLELEDEQAETLAELLDLAWFAGIRSGQAQLNANVAEKNPDIRAIALERYETDLRSLLETSADLLDLSLPSTIRMWTLMHQAWMAGNRTCKAEMIGLYLEMKSDVAEEALRWLGDED